MAQKPVQRGVTRRSFLQGAAATGIGGLVVGGAGGFFARGGGGASGQAASNKTPIKIGSSYPLTGPAAGDGQEMLHGAQLAIEEINAAGGIAGRPIQHIYYDMEDQAPEKVISTFKKLTQQDKVDAIIIGYTVTPAAEFDVVVEAQVPYLHVTTKDAAVEPVRKDPSKYWMIFQCDPTEVPYGIGLPKFMQTLQDKKLWTPANNNIAVITDPNAYSMTIANTFKDNIDKEGKWTISIWEQVLEPVADWGPTLAKIRANPPAIIANVCWQPGDLAQFMIKFMENPTNSLVYEQYGPSVPEYLDLAKDAANGVLWSTDTGTLPDKIGNDFRDRYKAKFNLLPGFSNAGSNYDEIYMYSVACAQAGGPENRKLVGDYLRKISYRGVNGAYMFFDGQRILSYPTETPYESLGNPHLYFQIKQQKHMLIAPDPYTQDTFELPGWIKA